MRPQTVTSARSSASYLLVPRPRPGQASPVRTRRVSREVVHALYLDVANGRGHGRPAGPSRSHHGSSPGVGFDVVAARGYGGTPCGATRTLLRPLRLAR